MKAVVAAFNQEKALVGAFSVITNLRMEFFQVLLPSLPPHLTMDRVQNTSSKNYGISNFYTWTGELIILKLPSPSSVPPFIIQLNSGFLVALNPITTRNKIGNIKM